MFWYTGHVGNLSSGLVYRTSEKKKEASLPHMKRSHKAALRVSSQTSVEPWVEIMIKGCGQIYMARTIGKIGWCSTKLQASLLLSSLGVQNPRNKAQANYHAQAAMQFLCL